MYMLSLCFSLTICLATVLQGANVKYTSIKFNSTFTKETIYRQKASPEVDAAWMALGTDCEYLSF
jgi:hypothetical protein